MHTKPQTTGELLKLFTKILKSYKRAIWIPNCFLYSYCRKYNLHHGICHKSLFDHNKSIANIFFSIYINDIKYNNMYICPIPEFTLKRIKQECFLPRIAFLEREMDRLKPLPADHPLEYYAKILASMN